ncbi:MAG: hypothetical protein QG579_382 [Patescibacteria group bacterium]|jgi:hypothetical protein|nr:hypothetical protein [Patescibacteria group bacterium]
MDYKKILSVFGIILVLVVVWYVREPKNGVEIVPSNNGDVAATTTEETKIVKTPTPGAVTSTSKPATLKSVLAIDGSHECKYEQVGQNQTSTNFIYISDNKLRAEFRTRYSTGKSESTLMVYDGRYLYVWTEGMATGVRTEPKSISELPDVIPADITSGKVLGTNFNSVSYDCHAWSRVSSMLVKPSYVKFN